MTIQELGATMKQKYPQYQDIPDDELGNRVLAKYPEYQNRISRPETPQDTRGTGEKVLSGIASVTGGKKLAQAAGQLLAGDQSESLATQNSQIVETLITQAKKYPMGHPRRTELLKKANETARQYSAVADEHLASLPTEKEVAGSAAKLGLTAATLGTSGLASGIKGGVGLVSRVAEGGLIGATFQALSNVESGEKAIQGNVAVAGAIGGALPLVGAGLRKIKESFRPVGEKIQYSLIKPTQADIKDGFNVSNLRKHGIGGDLKTMLTQTKSKLDDFSQQLKQKISSRPEATIDLNEVVGDTSKRLLGGGGAKFGDRLATRRALEGLASEVEDYSGNGLVDLIEAQSVKQDAGQKGAWLYKMIDPDSNARETVYNTFYKILKEKIEKTAPAGVKGINKDISELIPIIHAIIRRIPVAERNNALSLGDLILGGFTSVNPSSALLFLTNRLMKSGQFGKFLTGIESKPATTAIGKRIFGN